MKFLRSAWHVAAWAHEVTRALLPRTLLGMPVLLYRKEDGSAVAIGNRCPHRFAPLHLGKLVGDVVECGYHGLQFDCSGACVKNPHGDGRLPAAARVPHYPLVEIHTAFLEDREVFEAQHQAIAQGDDRPLVSVTADAGSLHAIRVIARLLREQEAGTGRPVRPADLALGPHW